MLVWLELFECTECHRRRTWGLHSGLSDVRTHKEGAQLHCTSCDKVTLHTFTGKSKEHRWNELLSNAAHA